ncbi:MAG: DUF1772 domain-containing protein [Notoacmeibacter sp.]|nr:DUF1772 domain-containing protein [Notoacmeibacter sp.]
MTPGISTLVQFAAIVLISLVAGSTFGVWRGYNPMSFSPVTYLEVHQGTVRGLNVLLPAMAAASLVLVVALAFMSRDRAPVLMMYLAAIVGIVAGGAVTRLANQPINADIMTWTRETMPSNWTEIRDTWWQWHVIRTFISVATASILIAAVFSDRNSWNG